MIKEVNFSIAQIRQFLGKHINEIANEVILMDYNLPIDLESCYSGDHEKNKLYFLGHNCHSIEFYIDEKKLINKVSIATDKPITAREYELIKGCFGMPKMMRLGNIVESTEKKKTEFGYVSSKKYEGIHCNFNEKPFYIFWEDDTGVKVKIRMEYDLEVSVIEFTKS